MHAIRRLLSQRHLAVLLCAGALLLKLLVPTGYMVANDRGAITIVICPGVTTETTTAMPGMGEDMAAMHEPMPDHAPTTDHGKVDMPCAYAGLSAQMLGAVDPVILLAALAVVAASALLTVPRAALQPYPYLRPPLRGPPLSLN